jgi:acetolactate synthase-1/2/3 large subunit
VEENGAEALQQLARECCVESSAPLVLRAPQPEWPETGAALTPDAMGRVLAHLLPEDAILSDETVSSGEALLRHLPSAPAHDLLPVTGGSIGQGLPVAIGAAVACTHRKVIALEADGSAMYTPQSLWTMARERLDVVVVILANRRYRILDIEFRRTGAGEMGPRASAMADLTRPQLDWVKLSEGLGVPAARAATVAEFVDLFRAAVRQGGPVLIEAALE